MSIKYTLYTRQIEVLHVISYMRVRGLLGTLFSIKILDQRARLLSRLNRRPGRESSLGPSRRVASRRTAIILDYWHRFVERLFIARSDYLLRQTVWRVDFGPISRFGRPGHPRPPEKPKKKNKKVPSHAVLVNCRLHQAAAVEQADLVVGSDNAALQASLRVPDAARAVDRLEAPVLPVLLGLHPAAHDYRPRARLRAVRRVPARRRWRCPLVRCRRHLCTSIKAFVIYRAILAFGFCTFAQLALVHLYNIQSIEAYGAMACR